MCGPGAGGEALNTGREHLSLPPTPSRVSVPSPPFEDKTLMTSFYLVSDKTHIYACKTTYVSTIFNVNFEGYRLRIT